MSKHYIHVKINNAVKPVKYISLIRKHDKASIAEIKNRILTGYAFSFNWYQPYCVVDDMNDVDPHDEFRLLIDKLISLGADLSYYDEFDGSIRPISLQIIDNMIERDKEIAAEIERDREREHGERDD
jgi:hypothetical protein